jgi:hypothetical protein
MFIRELRQLKHQIQASWLIMGDFNLNYKNANKNNGQLNRRLMLRFRRALNHMEVKEIQLLGRKFTWSNSQANPVMSKIDRAFCTPEWEDFFASPILQPLSSSVSNHCPLLLTPLHPPVTRPRFCFEFFWPMMEGFQDRIKEVWSRHVPSQFNGLVSLHIKLSRIAKALKGWSRNLVWHGKVALAICGEVIALLEVVHESREITQQERNLIKALQMRILGLATIEKCRARQKSIMT